MPECFYCSTELNLKNEQDAESCGCIVPGTLIYYKCPKCHASYDVLRPAGGEKCQEV